MASIRQLIGQDQIAGLAVRGVPTGLARLDELTRGLVPGALWVVVATPGVGRTVLACQIAASAAASGADTVLLLGGEPASTATVNILSAQARVPTHHLVTGELDSDDRRRTARVLPEVEDWQLNVLTPADGTWAFANGGSSMPNAALWFGLEPYDGRRLADVLVVDDFDLLTSHPPLDVLPGLRTWARRTAQSIVVTLPEELVLDGGVSAPALMRHSDIVVRLQRPEMQPQLDHGLTDYPRAGEADLRVLRHRKGPVSDFVVAFQGHYRRFADLD